MWRLARLHSNAALENEVIKTIMEDSERGATPPIQLGPTRTLVKGMVFGNRDECTSAVKDYALSQGRRAVLDKTKSGGLCKSEDEDNCAWFLRNAQAAGVQFQDVPVFSNQGRGLCAALKKSQLGLVLRFCTRHIIGNIKGHFKGNIPVDLETIVYRIQAAETEGEYRSLLFTLGITHPLISEYVSKIEAEKWTMYPSSLQEIKLYGWRTTNFVESVNNKAIKPRFLFPLQLFQHFMDEFMEDALSNQNLGERWKRDRRVVTPYAEDMIEEQRGKVSEYTVLWKNSNVAFVRSVHAQRVQHRVDISERTCTCSHIRQRGLPCRHFIAALDDVHQTQKMFEVCDPCYRVGDFIEGYGCGENGGVELVQPQQLSSDQTLPPEVDMTALGRKKSKRIPSVGEENRTTSAKKSYKCRICGGTGHNARTCNQG